MGIKLKFVAVSFLSLAASVWAGKWTIDSFDNSPDPGDPDKYIAAESGRGLTPVKPEQVTEQEGVIYVRQKFEDDLGREAIYQIFRGSPGPSAKNLGKISLEGIPYTTLLKMKLFYNKKADVEDDLENVYYDGKNILVVGEDPVYINLNGKMEELKPIIIREYKISITSEPAEAAVSVGNVSRGLTPASITLSSGKIITAVVSKEGYYTAVRPITPVDGQTVEEKVLLTARVPLNNPTVAYKTLLEPAIANKDAKTIRGVRVDILQTLSKYTAEVKKSIDSALVKFPANPPKLANESQEDFSARRTLWTSAQDKEKNALNKEAQDYFLQLKELLANVDTALEEIDFALKYEYVPASAMSLTNLGIKDFSINVAVENSRVSFKYDKAKVAYGTVPRNELAQNTDKVHGVLKIWDTPNENGKFVSIYDMAFFYNETPLKTLTKGSFTVGETTAASRTTEKDLNNRISKYSGKAAWNQKDSIATLAALRAGEISDPLAAKAPPPEEEEEDDAYYDEEEDEEEFEEEMEEQNKYDYARSGASRSATDIFGNTDEYIFWSAVALAATAVGTGIVGFLQNSTYLDADNAVKSAENEINKTIAAIRKDCGSDEVCFNDFVQKSSAPPGTYPVVEPDGPISAIYYANQNKAHNEKVRKSYNTSRIIWFSAAGVSAAMSVTLFLW